MKLCPVCVHKLAYANPGEGNEFPEGWYCVNPECRLKWIDPYKIIEWDANENDSDTASLNAFIAMAKCGRVSIG